MPVPVTPEAITQLAPNARSSYRAAFAEGANVLAEYAISATPLRVAHFMAQLLHESGALTVRWESLNYSPERIPKVWPTRFLPKGPLDPVDYAHAPEKLGDAVYGGRMGNVSPGDGYRFRGRGLLQLTGRDSYLAATGWLRAHDPEAPDLTVDPDAVVSSEWCLRVAAAEWFTKGCNALADQDAIRAVTRRINGGLIGIADRIEWLSRTRHIWS